MTGDERARSGRALRTKLGERPLMRSRIIWAPAVLLAVGVISFARDEEGDANFYSTAAQVIVTLYVAVAVDSLSGGTTDQRPKPTIEHWIYLVASSAGLLAALRGVLDPSVLVFSLTVTGVSATVLLLAESLVLRHTAGSRWAVLWTVLFIAALGLLVAWP